MVHVTTKDDDSALIQARKLAAASLGPTVWASGYVVLAINYRGSAGRGNAWQKAIHSDWGNLEVVDLLGAVDGIHVVGQAATGEQGIELAAEHQPDVETLDCSGQLERVAIVELDVSIE